MTRRDFTTHGDEQGERLRRELDISGMLAIERAAAEVVEPVARLWHDLVAHADMTVTAGSLERVLRDALETMSRLLSVNGLAILLANEAGDELMVRAAIGLTEELSIGMGIHAGEGMAGSVLASRTPIVVGDLSSIHVVNPVLRNSGLRSVAAVPMLSAGHRLGVMWAASYERDRFTLADAELLQVVADRLAAALDRVRTFERERAARREAERLADRISRIQLATAELAATHSPDDVARAVVRSLEAAPALWCGVWLAEDEQLELVAQSGASVDAADTGQPPPGWDRTVGLRSDAALATAVRDRRPTYGVTSDCGSGERSWAALPIVTRQGGAGALVVVAPRADWFTPDERVLLSLVVGQAVQALERAHLAEAERQAAERAWFFARAAQALAEAEDLAATLERLGDLAVQTLGEICIIDVVGEDGRIARMMAKHRAAALQPLVERLRTEFPPDPGGEHPAVRAIRSGEASWSADMPEEFLRATTVSEEHFAVVRTLGFRSYLTVPLIASSRVVGSVTCVSSTRRFRRDDMSFAEELARHVASVVDNARRYESAFRTSQILQSSLLPAQLPEVDGVILETRYLTANRGLEVGGDFYDVLVLPTGDVLFVVGDVAGHDRHAAAQMGHMRSALRALAGHASAPSALISAVRAAWGLLGFERIATALVGLLDPRSGGLAVASAGHYPPLIVSRFDTRFLPVLPGPPLGMDAPPATEWRGRLAEGQVLLGYTDGAIDERGIGSDESMSKLRLVASDGDVTPLTVCDRVVEATTADRADDVALLALALDRRTASAPS